MKSMDVLYDSRCGLCRRAVSVLRHEPKYVDLRFRARQTPLVSERFGELFRDDDELVVVADTGEVYRGTSAWIMVLYAMKRYRGLSLRLASPSWRGLATRAIGLISKNRYGLSRLFGLPEDHVIVREMHEIRADGSGIKPEGSCGGGACAADNEDRPSACAMGTLTLSP